MNRSIVLQERSSINQILTNGVYDRHMRALQDIYYNKRQPKQTDQRSHLLHDEKLIQHKKIRLGGFEIQKRNQNRVIHEGNQKIIQSLNKIHQRPPSLEGFRKFNMGSRLINESRAKPEQGSKRSERTMDNRIFLTHDQGRTLESRPNNRSTVNEASKTSLSTQSVLRRVQTEDPHERHKRMVELGKVNQKKQFYEKIRDQNLNMSKRINQTKPSLGFRELEKQFQHNRQLVHNLQRIKKDTETGVDMVGNMVFVDGRYRVPGSKYMSYSIGPSSKKGSRSRLGSSTSLKNSQGSEKQLKRHGDSKPGSRSSSVRSNQSLKSLAGYPGIEFKQKEVLKINPRNMVRSRAQKSELDNTRNISSTTNSYSRYKNLLQHNTVNGRIPSDIDMSSFKQPIRLSHTYNDHSKHLKTEPNYKYAVNNQTNQRPKYYEEGKINRGLSGHQRTNITGKRDNFAAKRYLGVA